MSKQVLIRVDASRVIGIGHVMRCITLANEAKQQGWKCTFVLRNPESDIVKVITSFGHGIEKLISLTDGEKKNSKSTANGNWLPVSQVQDAYETFEIIQDFNPDWIIVDHYALDTTWFSIINNCISNILVIDDLGDRNIICDLLLDQNLGASPEKYSGKVPRNCRLLLGPTFALLRNEFKTWRERSLTGRLERNIENILITMGGVDAENYTLRILEEIKKSKHAKKCIFTVIIGGLYPHTNSLHKFAESSSLKVTILSNVKNMAEIMSKSDLCIGAAGSTSWERCCLGQPTITFSIANNQIEIAEQLSKRNVAIYSDISYLIKDFEQFFGASGRELQRALSTNSSLICDGFGASRVLKELERKFEN